MKQATGNVTQPRPRKMLPGGIIVRLCRPDDPMLASCWSEKGGWEQTDDEPVRVVIGRETTDEKCHRLAARFGLDVADLFYFRADKPTPDGGRVVWWRVEGKLA